MTADLDRLRERRDILEKTQRFGTFTADIVADYDVLLSERQENKRRIAALWDGLMELLESIEASREAADQAVDRAGSAAMAFKASGDLMDSPMARFHAAEEQARSLLESADG